MFIITLTDNFFFCKISQFSSFLMTIHRPWRPADCEENDDDQEHLDNLFSTLVDLLSLAKLIERSGTPETRVESF